MRVLTLNVQSFRAGVDRIAEVIRATDPDVVALQEAYRRPSRALARSTGLGLIFGARRPLRRFGNALLARDPMRDPLRVRFTKTAALARRAAVVAVLPSGIAVASLHLGLSQTERERHAAELLRALGRYERVVLCGDINESPGGAAYRLLAARFTDVFASAGEGTGETFPAAALRERIDYVFCSRDLTPVRAAVVPIVASDHLAVVAEIAEIA